MQRILHIVSSLKKHGTETFIMNAFHEMPKDKIAFDFLVFDDSKDGYYNELLENGAQIFFLPPRRKNFFQYHKKLEDFFASHAKNYNGVHMHGSSLTTLAPLKYAKKYGIASRIIHIHAAAVDSLHNRILHSINRHRLKKYANIFLSCSNKASQWGYKKTGVLDYVKVIPNGIRPDNFKYNSEKREEKRKELGLGVDDFVVINVARLEPVKNHKFLIEIIDNLKKRGIEVKLLLSGDGSLERTLKKIVAKKDLNSQVLFLGNRNDIPDLLSASDIMVFPSLNEGLGIALIEAQANGLPVLASDEIPAETKISPVFHTLPLNIGPKIWAEKIIEIKNKKSLREPSNSLKTFTIQNTVNNLLEIYSAE